MFPTPLSLSEAPDWQVYEIVQHLGLGFQRTARLKAMAKSWGDLWDSTSPLPGLGPYGSGIVRLASGLQDASVPIDGNIARIFRRYYKFNFEKGEPRKKPAIINAMRHTLEEVGDPQYKLMLIHGLVDLGAIVCRPSTPRCDQCPLRLSCLSSSVTGPSESKNSLTVSAKDRARGGGTASDTI